MIQAYDRAKLIELFGHDPAMLAEVEREFVETARDAEREIRGTDDLATLAQAAHRLKGASGMIGAVALQQVAEAVERAAKAHDLASVHRLHGPLADEVQRVAAQTGVVVD